MQSKSFSPVPQTTGTQGSPSHIDDTFSSVKLTKTIGSLHAGLFFSVFFVACSLFFKLTFPKKFFLSNVLDQDQDLHSVGPDLDPNSLKRSYISRRHIQLARTDVKELHDMSELLGIASHTLTKQVRLY